MSAEHRDLALRRIDAIRRWHSEEPDYSSDQAAEDAGVSLSRFYRLAREWENPDRRTLSSLGLGTAGRPHARRRARTKSSRLVFDRALEFVSEDPRDEKSVSRLVNELRNALSPEIENIPGTASLRATIVEARRRRDIEDEVGVDVAFDISAVGMRDERGDLHRIAVCIDRGTGLIFGAALAAGKTARKCYAPVAADALARVMHSLTENIPWSDRFERCEFIVLIDTDKAWKDELTSEFPRLGVQPSNSPRRFGRYIRKHVGDGIGTIRLLPTLTISGEAAETSAPKRRFSVREAEARLRSEVDAHNRRVLQRLGEPARAIRPELMRFLEYVSGG